MIQGTISRKNLWSSLKSNKIFIVTATMNNFHWYIKVNYNFFPCLP